MNQNQSGHTLLEVVIALSITTVIWFIVMQVLLTSTGVQETQLSRLELKSSGRRTLGDIAKHLRESRVDLVDTKMRWKGESSEEYEVFDRFHAWFLVTSRGDDLYPGLVQCAATECPWARPGGEWNVSRSKFVTNYNYGYDGYNYFFYENLLQERVGTWSSSPHRGVSHNGRMYRMSNQRSWEQMARCAFDGSRLRALTQLDVLQFPVPRDQKQDILMTGDAAAAPRFGGWLIYAPLIKRSEDQPQMRRFSVFVSDLFFSLPWKNGERNPLYADPNHQKYPVDDDARRWAGKAGIRPVTSEYVPYYYNEISVDAPDGRPPFWSDPRPHLLELFDFDGDGLVETEVNAGDGDLDDDGNPIDTGTVNGQPTPDSETSREWFRLIPTRSPGNYYNDWTGDPPRIKALVYEKYARDSSAIHLKPGADVSVTELEVHYFIDLRTGWTRFYYYCSWQGGEKEYRVDASFRRMRFEGMTSAYRSSSFFFPYRSFARGMLGLDFSVHLRDETGIPLNTTFPMRDSADNLIDPAGVPENPSAVRLGILLGGELFYRGTRQRHTVSVTKTVSPQTRR